MEASAILVLLVLPGALAGPVQWRAGQNMCATRCPDSSKYKYETGTSYEYLYEAETRTTMSGAAEDTATITVTAAAVVEKLADCEMALRLRNVEIRRSHEQNPRRMVGADDMSRARRALEEGSLRFAFYDGAVGELCPEDGEDTWALNIKRGVLTSFQNSMRQLDREEHVQETDVTGQCPTHYKVTQKGWKTLTVTKVKDMLSCTDRHGYRTSVLASPYRAPNTLQSVPVMKTTHECEHDVSQSEGILQRSSCQEVHVFRPFSKASSGAVTEASQKLTFRSKSRGVNTQKGPISRRTTLMFEHKMGTDKGDSVFVDVKNKLKEICQITEVDIRPQVSHMFGELVHLMRNLDYDDLRDLDRQLQKRKMCPDNYVKTRKFFQDALPMAATADALRVMSDLLISDEVKDTQATFWLTSIAFLPSPTKEMIAAVQPLLTNSKIQQDAMLAVSSLVNNYCERHPTCAQDQEVQDLLETLTTILGDDCNVDDNNFKQVLLALRAIGNIGRSEIASLRLQRCFTQSDHPMEVRIAAIDAYRRMPCSADRIDVMEMFLRQTEDSELRVAAYLAVMKCPSDYVLSQVRKALQAEEVNQVGSFVWTHLTNLLETDSPHKQAIRDVLESELLQKEFRRDLRKNSRNYELSFFSDKFNLGGVFENNLIWSPTSFIPRSAMLNLTVDMFGHSVNLLEVGGRVQGLQYLLETYFGPSSEDKGSSGGYGRTDVVKNEKMTRTKNKYGQVKDDLRAQMYLRVFGNELTYGMLDGSDMKKLQNGKAKDFFTDLGKKLIKDGEVSFTQSAMFMDSTIVIPTAVGLPLNLTVNGSASVELQASQKMNFKKINAKSKAFEIAAEFQPSGVVEVSSMMSVDAFVTKVGLKMTSRLHSSTAVKGSVELARGQILSVEIDTPREKLEIFDFQSKFYIVHDSYEKEQKMVTTNRKEKQACTGKPLAKILGMELCASLSFPNATADLAAPYFPFTGPTAIAVTLNKHDVHSGYKLLAKQIQTSSSVITQVALDTPGSTVDRAISLGYVVNIKDKTLEGDLLSPWKKVTVKMSMEQTKKFYKANAAVTVDTDKEYNVKAQLDKDIRDRKEMSAKLKPMLLVTSPDGTLLSITGAFDYRQNKHLKTNAVVDIKDVLKRPITVDYTLAMRSRADKMRYKNNLKLSSQFVTLKTSTQTLMGSFISGKKGTLMTVRAKADYNIHFIPSIKRNIVNLGLKIHDRSTAALKKYGVSLNFDAKKTPEASLLLNGEVSHKKTLTEMEVKIRHGQNVKLKANKDKELLVSGFVAHKINGPQATVRFELQTVYPEKGIEYEVKGKHEHRVKNSTGSIEDYLNVRYAKGKSVDVHMRLAQNKKKRSATFDLSYPAGQSYPARDVKINADFMEKTPKHHVLTALASLQKGEKNSLVVSFKRPTSKSVEISSEVGIHNRLPIQLDLSGNYALRNMKGQGELTCEGKTYSADFTSDIQKEKPYATFTAQFIHPERRITVLVEGGRDTEEAVKRGKVEIMWDADKDPSQKAGVTMEFADVIKPKDVNVGGMLEVFTPVKKYQHSKVEFRFENSARRILTTAGVILGDDKKDYSAGFLLRQPLTKENFKTRVWLKTFFKQIRHVDVRADHSFDDSGSLTTTLKSLFNGYFLNVGISGSSKGDLITRVLEGAAFFNSSIPGTTDVNLSFNHRDSNDHYVSQAVLDAKGNQYSANMDANFQKVHWQITTDGTVTVRAPQLTTPVEMTWQHKNSLHELNSAFNLSLRPRQRIQLEVGGKADIVSNVYDGRVMLTGPWNVRGADYQSELTFHHQHSRRYNIETSANLKLNQDSYVASFSYKRVSRGRKMTTSMTMSKYPKYSFLYMHTLCHSDFPYSFSAELSVAEQPLANVELELENPRTDVYRSNSRVVLHMEDSVENVAVKARHEKNRKNQWVTRGDLEFQVGSKVTFSTMLDFENPKKLLTLDVDTPYDEVRNIRLEYSHSGNVTRDFNATCSLSVDPHFDTVSAGVSWSNRDQFQSSLRVDTPFDEMRYLDIKSQSSKQGDKRHSTLSVDYSPRQLYKVDTVYSFDFPQGMDIMLNLTTPRKEFPSLHTEIGYQYTDDEVTGKFKLTGPPTNFEEFSTNFGHRRGPKSLNTLLNAAMSPGKRWSGRANLNWENEIDGTLTIESNPQEKLPMQIILNHRGHTWKEFRTKAGFKMNGDRLESEVAYSHKNGTGMFMLATPDPDIDFLKTTFFQRQSTGNFEGRYTVQYGETSKPYELGLATTNSDVKIAFSTDLKTPHTEDLDIEIGFARHVEVKLLGMYGSDNKIDTLVKYVIRDEFWDVGGEFEYLLNGSGRDIGLTFKRKGSLEDLKCYTTAKYMGKQVNIDTQYKDGKKKSGRVDVRTNFKDYTALAASFDHSGGSTNFESNLYLKYKDDKEAKGTIDFQRNKWKRVTMTSTFNLPFAEYQDNKLTYKHISRKNKFSADAVLKLGLAHAINGKVEFVDNSRLTVSVKGPFKDFDSFTASGTFDEAEKKVEGDATLRLLSQRKPISATYMVTAGIWPIMVNVKAQTPFEGWTNVEFTTTHDGEITDFTSSSSLKADAVGTVTSETIWTYSSPYIFDGLWTMSSSVEGAENLKLAIKNLQAGNEYSTRFIVGWEFLKEIIMDASLQIGDDYSSNNRYKGSVALTTPFQKASQFSVSFDHSHNDRRIQDSATAKFNDKTYLDADFDYSVGERRVGSLKFREPRPMEFLIGGQYNPRTVEGELKLNWDKRVPEMNIHLTGDYTDRTDNLGTDKTMKLWAVHPARTMGIEYLMKRADKEFQSDFLLTWDKATAQTLSYIINWTDRTSRYSSAYDAMVKVGVPMRSVQMEGMYSNTGRVKAAEGAVMWDADGDKNMKLGLKGQVDKRGKTNKVQLGLDLPFVEKEYSLTTETAMNSGSTLLDTRTEFSYSVDPRKLLVVSTRIDDLSYGTDATNYSLALSVVHPMTYVNVTMTSHVGNSQALSTMGTKLEYLTAQREKKNVELRASIDKLKKLMDVELMSPIKTVAVEGEMSGEHNYNLRLATKEDGQTSQVTHIFINPDSKTFEMTFRYDKAAPNNSLNLLGHMINDNMLQTEMYRMENGQRVSETLMTVRLNSSHVLHTRLNWRPLMLTDLQRYLGTQLTVFSYGSNETFWAGAQVVGREVQAKYNAIMEEVKEEAGPLLQQLQEEMKRLQTHLNTMKRDLRRFYESNALHVQDMSEMVNGALTAVMLQMDTFVREYRQMYVKVKHDITEAMKELSKYPMAAKYAQLVSDFANGLKNSRVVLEQALDELMRQLGELSDRSYRRYLTMSRQIERKLEGYTAALRQTPQYQKLANAYTTARSSLTQLSNGQYKQLADAANRKLMVALEKLGLKESYLMVVTKSKQLISDQFHDLMQRPEFQQIYVITTEIYQQGVWAYQYWHVEKNMRLAVAQLLELAKDVALLEITHIKNAVVDLDKSRVIVFDPQNGELQFEIYLPVPLKSLVEPPDMRVTKYVNRIKSWVATYIPSPRHSLWTSINSYIPNMNTDTWLPPYTAYAYVMGDQHVVTFDRKHYNFAGRCSYILARDMIDDRFSIVLQYNNRPRQPQVQSIVVMLRGVSIEVDRDNKVKVNNQETELPFFSGTISAVRQQSIIRVQDGEAVTVEMDSSRGIYGVKLSGWYHGRTAGLLGTYDNEHFNDLTNSERQLTTDVEAFANSWEVSRRYCRSRNLADNGDLDRELAEVQACEKHLNDSSSYYSPCFGQVEAGELIRVCMKYIQSGHTELKAQCQAGQQYRYMCHRRGISLGTPSQCVSCQFPDGQAVSSGRIKEVRTEAGSSKTSADVVFVVEESACNSWAQRSLSTLATELGQALAAKGLSANRFGLVSYYGNASHDQQLVHTIEGEVFGDPNNFLKATENLRLLYTSSPADAAAAVREAVKYPFRVGVAKLLILLPCSGCTGDLYSLTQVLTSHGFMLHVLNDQKFKVTESANHSPVRVFGLDNSKAHTQKSAARQSEDIFQQMQVPSEACAQLALSTNGSVFDVNHMSERGRIQNEFLESFAARGAHNAMPPSCQVCSCHDDGMGRGHTVCRLCDNNSWLWNHIPTWLQSSSTNVMGVFNDLHHQMISSLHVPGPESAAAA